jgi:hypothetical protein
MRYPASEKLEIIRLVELETNNPTLAGLADRIWSPGAALQWRCHAGQWSDEAGAIGFLDQSAKRSS